MPPGTGPNGACTRFTSDVDGKEKSASYPERIPFPTKRGWLPEKQLISNRRQAPANPQRSFQWVSERDGSFRHQKDGAYTSRPADTFVLFPQAVSKGSFLAGNVFLLPERCDPVTRADSENEPSGENPLIGQSKASPKTRCGSTAPAVKPSALLQVGVRTGRFLPAPKRRCLHEPSR